MIIESWLINTESCCLKMNYYEHFKTFIPAYKKQYFKAKVQDDMQAILTIKENIWKNWNLTKEQKNEVLKIIGLAE